jgi:hypothetical protein
VTSAIFDGRVVHLRGARGEVLGVQVLRASSDPAALSLAIDGAGVRAWRVDDVHVARPSTDMYGPSRGAGDYPDELVPGQGGEVSAKRDALFDVAIARDAGPGVHAGSLRVDGDTFAVELEVVPVELPPIDEHPRVWAYYNPSELARAGLDEAPVAAMFRADGVLASPELTPADAAAREAQVRGARFVPVLLPASRDEIARDARTWAAWSARTGQQPFAIPVDEPHTIAAKLEARTIARWLHAAGGGVWLAVTDAPDWLYGGDVDVFVAPGAPGTGPPDRRWTYNGAPPRAGAMIADTDGVALRTWGWIGFLHDVPLWYVWDAAYWRDKYNAAKRGDTRDSAPRFDPSADAATYDDGEDIGNLDGVLFYPDGQPSLRLVALRRGIEDRALLDALAACAGRPTVEAIARQLVPSSLGDLGDAGPGPGAWPVDEAAWESARRAVLDGLVACHARP